MSGTVYLQVTSAAAIATTIPPTLRAPRLAIRIGLRHWNNRGPVTDALVKLGWGVIGSQRFEGADVMLMSATDAALVALAAKADAAGNYKGALANIATLALCSPVMSLPADQNAYADGRFEAVLHPRLDTAPETAIARFASFAAELGGSLDPRWARLVDGLIFVPVRLPPDRAREAASYQPLRVLRPMGRVALRGERAED